MLSVFYTILFVVSVIMLICLLVFFKKTISVYYVLMFSALLISNMGYMQVASAKVLDAAIFGNQVTYLGASFSPFFLLMCLTDLCKVQIKRIYRICFLIWGCVTFILISTVGVTQGYYRSISLVRENGVSFLVREYGPLHTLYPAYLLLIMAIGIGCIIKCFRNNKDVSYTTSSLLMVCTGIAVCTYVVEKSFHIQAELMPFAYFIAQIGVLVLLRRISLYDVSAISTDAMVESITDGFVLCDSRGRYLGSDEAAKIWFPELKDMHIDIKMQEENSPVLKQMGKWMRGEERREVIYFEVGEVIVEARHSILHKNTRNPIHCMYLRDDTQQQRYAKLMREYNINLEADVNKKTEKLRKVQEDIIISMASIVENRDNNTGGHIRRTSDVVKVFVAHLQDHQHFDELTDRFANCIVKAAPLHDFGKIAVPDEILNKPGKFEPEEYEKMKQHSAKGAVIVEQILHNSDDEYFRNIAVNVAHFHHEKWDGTGYPKGLSGESIPFEARVMALADVFDALVSKRVYKERMPYDKAFSIIEESSGTHFEPILCREFLECREELIALYDSYGDED